MTAGMIRGKGGDQKQNYHLIHCTSFRARKINQMHNIAKGALFYHGCIDLVQWPKAHLISLGSHIIRTTNIINLKAGPNWNENQFIE